MATNVIMPALGMSQETGRLIQWLVEPGAAVSKGDPLMEIETDKATVEVEAPASGILTHVVAANGDEVPVAQVIATIVSPDEVVAPGDATRSTGAAIADPRARTDEVVARTDPHEQAAASASSQRVRSSPKARRLAAEEGLALEEIRGTGPGGAVLTADVLTAMKPPAAVPAVPATVPATGESSLEGAPAPAATESLSTIWRVMADRMTQSWTTVPQFTLSREVNAEQLIAWRTSILKHSEEKVTFTDLLVKVVATALTRHPRLNNSWRDGAIAVSDGIHVGIAVAVDEGLVVPVVHHADRLGVGEIAGLRNELTGRARAGRLRVEDLSGGTFTISNLGMYGVDAFKAIVNPPQAAILALGRIAERVVPVDGQPAVRPTLILTLSCDHRVVDGARGASFLDTIADLIDEPLGILR